LRVLVTGGLGFVGHTVTRQLLDAGHHAITVTSRPDARSSIDEVDTVHADIRDREGLTRAVRRESQLS
jgi:UDP-glucose 4-epimerase